MATKDGQPKAQTRDACQAAFLGNRQLHSSCGHHSFFDLAQVTHDENEAITKLMIVADRLESDCATTDDCGIENGARNRFRDRASNQGDVRRGVGSCEPPDFSGPTVLREEVAQARCCLSEVFQGA